MNQHLRHIVARINGLSNEIKHTKASTKLNNAIKQRILMTLKTEARHTMLAYAFLRGVPYRVVEGSCNELPSAWQLARVFTSFNIEAVKTASGKTIYFTHLWAQPDKMVSDLEKLNAKIQTWLSVPAMQSTETTLTQSVINGVRLVTS